VVPLHVDAPGANATMESPRFVLAGKTLKGAALTVAGQNIAVGPDGSFAQTMSISAPGTTTIEVRATAPEQAPRTVLVHLKRVESLAAEARDFTSKATLPFSDLVTDVSKHIGEPIALEGEVAEVRPGNHFRVVLLDVQKGCAHAPCLARVITRGDDA